MFSPHDKIPVCTRNTAGTCHSMPRCVKIQHRAHTRATHDPITAGIPIPVMNPTSMQLAQLFVLHVFSKHGVPSHVTSDHRTEFVSHFFRSLGKALNMKLYFTSGYHPEGDGQTKCTNQTLEQYICWYCNY